MRNPKRVRRGWRALGVSLALLPGLAGAEGHALLEVTPPGGAPQALRLDYAAELLRLQRAGEAAQELRLQDDQWQHSAPPPLPTTVALADHPVALDAPAPLPLRDLGLACVVEFLGLDDTGRSETVAGVSGRVYLLSYRDAEGARRREQLVLSADPRARELAWALQRLTVAAAAAPAGARQLAAELQTRKLGPLRLGERWHVRELATAASVPPPP